MFDQFAKVLRTPKTSSCQSLNRTQDIILSSFQDIFPSSLNLQTLHQIYRNVLEVESFPSKELIQITFEQQIELNYRLTQFLIDSIKSNFVSIDVYKNLQEQTQRAEQNIRAHIRLQQQMKMYLQYLEAKIQKLNHKLFMTNQTPENVQRQLIILQTREAVLQKEKINLMKKNQKLKEDKQVLQSKLKIVQQSMQQTQKFVPEPKNLKISRNNFTDRSQTAKNYQYLLNEVELRQQTTNNTSKLTVGQMQKERERFIDQKVKVNLNLNVGLASHKYDMTQKKKSTYFPGKI